MTRTPLAAICFALAAAGVAVAQPPAPEPAALVLEDQFDRKADLGAYQDEVKALTERWEKELVEIDAIKKTQEELDRARIELDQAQLDRRWRDQARRRQGEALPRRRERDTPAVG